MANTLSHSPRLMEQVRERIRVKHYSLRTEEAYLGWIRQFIQFHGKRHPKDMGKQEVEAFLTHLAVARHVAAATQSQAKSALLFLYKEVLRIDLPWLNDLVAAKQPKRLPVVLTQHEVGQLLSLMQGTWGLLARLLYGTGMRVMEGLRLRVQDIDFNRRERVIREGKGFKDRVTMLPASLVQPLQQHLLKVRQLHQRDLEAGFGEVFLP